MNQEKGTFTLRVLIMKFNLVLIMISHKHYDLFLKTLLLLNLGEKLRI